MNRSRRRGWIGAAAFVLAAMLWLGLDWIRSRHARGFLANFTQGPPSAATGTGTEDLRNRVNAFGPGDWQHLINEGVRDPSPLERSLLVLRNRLPAPAQSWLPAPDAPLVRWNALGKAWLLSAQDLDDRRCRLLRSAGKANPQRQHLIAELCTVHPRSHRPILSPSFLTQVRDTSNTHPALRPFLLVALAWEAPQDLEPGIRALLGEWARDPDPQLAEGAARTLARRPLATSPGNPR